MHYKGVGMGISTATSTQMQNNFGKYLKLIMAGQEVIVTKNGKAVGRFIQKGAASCPNCGAKKK